MRVCVPHTMFFSAALILTPLVLFVFALLARLFSPSSAFGAGALIHKPWFVYGRMHRLRRHAFGHTCWLSLLADLLFLCAFCGVLFVFAIDFLVVCVALVPSLLSYLGILMRFCPIGV